MTATVESGRLHAARTAGAQERRRKPIDSLGAFLREYVSLRLERLGLTDRRGPVLIFGAGRHTWWLVRSAPAMADVAVVAILDDAAAPGASILGIPVLTPVEAARRFPSPRAVILSTDAWRDELAARAREVFGDDAPVVDVYEGLPPGPYARDPGPYASTGGAVPLAEPTEACLRRTVAPLAAYLAARGLRAPHLIGQEWQTFAVQQELGSRGVVVARSAREADCGVVCDARLEGSFLPALAPGLIGPLLRLRRGERPWIDRSARSTGLPPPRSGARGPRIVIRHDNNLGDVTLSQGVLPERIKTELHPDAEIVFATTRSAYSRRGSDTTGWCLDLIRANPWIDRCVASDEADGVEADVRYTIGASGELYDHVFDHHAMRVELPPGRTDARVHLSEDDRALARRMLGGGRRPRVAVNMNLIAKRFRAWGEEPTAELCARLEDRHGVDIVWIGWLDWAGRRRLAHDGRNLGVREQAAVLAQCDLHVTAQGAGANLSGAVGTQTLSLSGCHPPEREGVAYFANPYVEDPSRRHVEMYRYGDDLRVLTYSERREVDWMIRRGETQDTVWEYEPELWNERTALHMLPDEECYTRVRSLTVDEVESVVAAMLEARRTGRPAPGA